MTGAENACTIPIGSGPWGVRRENGRLICSFEQWTWTSLPEASSCSALKRKHSRCPRHVLIADVKFSTRDWTDSIHPAQEDDFSLPFPSVRFDPATKRFTAHGVAVGTLRNGFLGPEVVLNPEVALSIHRHHGIVNAALIREDVTDY